MGIIQVDGKFYTIHFRHARKKDQSLGSSVPVDAITTVVIVGPSFCVIENIVLQAPDQFSRPHARHYAMKKACKRGPLAKIPGFLAAYEKRDPRRKQPLPKVQFKLSAEEKQQRIDAGADIHQDRAREKAATS